MNRILLNTLLASGVSSFALCRTGPAQTSAWICNAGGARREAPCHFFAGQQVTRLLCLSNGTPRTVRYIYRFETSLAGKHLAADEDTDSIPALSAATPAVRFTLPTGITARAEGIMTLIASVDGQTSTGAVPFSVHAAGPPPDDFALYDPGGRIKPLLDAWGVTPPAWSETNTAMPLLIVPELKDKAAAPADKLVRFVSEGRRALILNARPDWLLDRLGLRTCEATGTTYRVVAPEGRLLAGLRGEDFPPGHHPLVAAPYPPGWKPLIETADGAGSPLLVFVGTDGLGYLCLFDLTESGADDSAASVLVRRLLHGGESASQAR